MHHRIMVRRERESKSEIAGFGGFNLPFPAISNRLESEKETPAQSLRTLFTDDDLVPGDTALIGPCENGVAGELAAVLATGRLLRVLVLQRPQSLGLRD